MSRRGRCGLDLRPAESQPASDRREPQITHGLWPARRAARPSAIHISSRPPHPSNIFRPDMLNYIWAGLIVTSFLFALGYDARDIAGDKYRNGRPLPLALAFTGAPDSAARRVPVEIRIDPRTY